MHFHHYHYIFFLVITTLSFFMTSPSSSANLSIKFYDKSCPEFPVIVRQEMERVVATSPRMGASILRLLFHDCFVNGCDGSILLADTKSFIGEQTAPPNNNSVRGFKVIDLIKQKIESSCKGVVSCADILAVAARDAVTLLGGPFYEVALGRRDSATTSLDAVSGQLPAPFFNLSQLISSFASKGFTPAEMTVLSGAHTIGQARCATFRGHIFDDSNIDEAFAKGLRAVCAPTSGDNNVAALDTLSPNKFDNSYFRDLVAHRSLLHSDQELFNEGPMDELVRAYARSESLFQRDFAAAMTKLGSLSPLTGKDGEVRRHCFEKN